MVIGINVGSLAYFGSSRTYGNLAAIGPWSSNIDGGLKAAQIDIDGTIKYLNPGERAIVYINAPEGPYTTKEVRCTFDGTGKIGGDSDSVFKMLPNGAGRGPNYVDLTYNWEIVNGNVASGFVYIDETNPADPVRNIDCREKDMDKGLLWSPQYIESMKGFGIIRFLDWSEGNSAKSGDWSKFVSAGHQFRNSASEGVRPDDLIGLANIIDADPWLTLAYNGDENYHRKYATLVRDTMKPGRRVYVELANEVWNYMFPVTSQARDEGVAAKLSADSHQAMLYRYGQKSAWALKIWSEVFAGQMDRLVRVVNVQGWGWSTDMVLIDPATRAVVDAIAIAPYIQLNTDGLTLDQVYASLDKASEKAITEAVWAKATAKQYGKRLIAYEAGQHLVANDVVFSRQIQRDPRMESVYRKYMDAWATQVGDVMVMYSHTGSISQYGSWGLREYGSQSPSEAPKWRAVQSYLKK